MATFTTAQILAGTTIEARKGMIKANIQEGPWEWTARALEVIFERQTADEQDSGQTTHENGIGFNGLDAEILSSFAKQVKRWKGTPEGQRRFPVPLSEKQLNIARRKMAKYAGQLERIVREKIGG
jgi:hypothetical protein